MIVFLSSFPFFLTVDLIIQPLQTALAEELRPVQKQPL